MLDFIFSIGDAIMFPLYYLTSGILLAWHSLFSLVMPYNSGASWILSIIGLTVVIRAALIPLFVKQIKSSRNMQLLQPRVKELQKKYSHDRERLTQETMALYKETGTNPFASCLPLIVQMPIFFALFRVVDHAAQQGQGHGFLTNADARIFADAKIFGITVSDSLTSAESSATIVLAAFLVLAMTATTFLTQRQLMSKNMPADALSGPYAQQQKLLLYVLPLVFAVGGIAFPVAVLFYWTTSNLWTMCQQFYVIRNNPAPGTPAFAAKAARDKAKGNGSAVSLDKSADGGGTTTIEAPPKPPPPRPQPQRQTRSERSQRPAPPAKGSSVQRAPSKPSPGKPSLGKPSPGKPSPGKPSPGKGAPGKGASGGSTAAGGQRRPNSKSKKKK